MHPQVLTYLLLKTMLWQDTRKMQHTPNMFFSYYLTSQAYLTDFIADKENWQATL